MSGPTRVLVIEDHPLYRSALVGLVEEMPGWIVVGAYGDAEGALAADDVCDVAVIDLGLPGMDGVAALRTLRKRRPDARVLVLTMSEDASVLAAAVRAGAGGYLVKGAEPDDIERALRGVAKGQAIFGHEVAEALLTSATRRARTVADASFPQLTGRELEVLELVSEGRSNAEIADLLFVSPKTARNHVSAVLVKLGVATRAEAVARARDAGVGPSP